MCRKYHSQKGGQRYDKQSLTGPQMRSKLCIITMFNIIIDVGIVPRLCLHPIFVSMRGKLVECDHRCKLTTL